MEGDAAGGSDGPAAKVLLCFNDAPGRRASRLQTVHPEGSRDLPQSTSTSAIGEPIENLNLAAGNGGFRAPLYVILPATAAILLDLGKAAHALAHSAGARIDQEFLAMSRLPGVVFLALAFTLNVAAAAASRSLKELPLITTIAVPPGPGWLGVGFGSVWVSKSASHLLLRIDPVSNAVVARIPVGPDPELGIGIGLGSVWIADTKERSLRQIDPATNKVVRKFAVNVSGEPEGSIAIGAGSVWLLTNDNGTDSGTLSRLEPATGKVIATIPVKPRSYAALVADDSVWISNSADASVQRVDARTNQVVADVPVRSAPRFLAAGEGALWVLSQGEGVLTRIDPATNRASADIPVGFPGPGGDLWIDDGVVWASAEGAPVSMIDPRTNTLVAQFTGGKRMDTLRAAFGAVWVLEESTGKLWKLSIPKLKQFP